MRYFNDMDMLRYCLKWLVCGSSEVKMNNVRMYILFAVQSRRSNRFRSVESVIKRRLRLKLIAQMPTALLTHFSQRIFSLYTFNMPNLCYNQFTDILKSCEKKFRFLQIREHAQKHKAPLRIPSNKIQINFK